MIYEFPFLPTGNPFRCVLRHLVFITALVLALVGASKAPAAKDAILGDQIATAWIPDTDDPAEEIAEAASRYFRKSDFVENDDGGLRLSVRGRVFLFIEGTINATSHDAVKALLDAKPNVHTLVLTSVPGSMDDETNLRLGRMVRERNLTTFVPEKGMVASGGTDLFLAGARRILSEGARVGVHSWGGEAADGTMVDGRDVPRDADGHQLYLGYYRDLGIAEKFYWFTLAAAPAADIHFMSEAEHEYFRTFTDWLPKERASWAEGDEEEDNDPERLITNPYYVVYLDRHDISLDVESVSPEAARYYAWYITYWAPNGKPVHILAQDRITYDQVLRAYGILDFYLTDVIGARFGSDKAAVANAMADQDAVLVMPNGADDEDERGIPEAGLMGQPLYQLEFPIEGSRPYTDNDFDQRDAGFEEILHLVHDNGIGTIETPGALKPIYQREVLAASKNALEKRIWTPPVEVLEEWIQEGSVEQEYLATVIDSYYGLWGAWSETPGGMYGGYVAKTRADIEKLDSVGLGVVQEFFSPHLTYMARVHPGFEGRFSMTFDPKAPYTHKSRYLLNARLLGSGDSALIGNDLDNILIGNGGDNFIDARDGIDVVQFSGASYEYEIAPRQAEIDGRIEDCVEIEDLQERDGATVVCNVEFLRFTDADLPLH